MEERKTLLFASALFVEKTLFLWYHLEKAFCGTAFAGFLEN